MKKIIVIFVVAAVSIFLSASDAVSLWSGLGVPPFPKKWRSFTHVKSMVIPDKNHGLYGFHHIYANKGSINTLKKGGSYPEGAEFVGVFYDVVTEKDGSITQGKKLFYVYMRKADAAKQTGGWHYAAYDPQGNYLKKDVKKECFECHIAAKDSDYIYSKFIE
ncbi:MAG: cytochrome P460 family protein [Nitrospirae bacterium]|nr:cytochrome P460 family protein [Nitrospirota bacterium]